MGEPEADSAGDDGRGRVGHSRRDFLVSAAGLTGVAIASGAWRSPALADPTPAGGATAAAGPAVFVAAGDVIDLTLDGADAGFVLSAEGGHATADVVTEKLGADHIIHKHIAGVKYEDLTVSSGSGMGKAMYQWIKSSFDGKFSTRSGALTVADFNSKAISTLKYSNAQLTDIGFPALDASSKDAAKMTIKFQPETTRYSASGGQPPPRPSPVQKKWTASNFKLEIDGLDASRVNKIEAIVVHQVAETVDGEGLKEPAHLEFPNLSIQLPESSAATWFTWHEDFVINGNSGAGNEKNGQLTFMTDNGTPLFTIKMLSLGIFKLTPEKVEAGSESVRRLNAELYCDQLTFFFPSTTT